MGIAGPTGDRMTKLMRLTIANMDQDAEENADSYAEEDLQMHYRCTGGSRSGVWMWIPDPDPDRMQIADVDSDSGNTLNY